jgi:hypothetical protein
MPWPFPTNHADNVNEVIHASTINDLADAVNKVGPSYSLFSYATGDGVTDDQAGIVAALTAAGSTGVVTSPPGKTYLVGSSFTVTGRFDLNGSTIKKKSTMTNTEAMLLTGSNAVVRNVVVEGNKAAGATGSCIRVTGTATLENVTVQNSTTYGVDADTGSNVTCRNVTASGHTLDGFLAQNTASGTGGILNMDVRCVGNNNGRSGVLIYRGGNGCRINGTFFRNSTIGVWINTGDNGTSDWIYGYDNDYQNVLVDNATAGLGAADWKFGTIIAPTRARRPGSRPARTLSSRARHGFRSGRSSPAAAAATGWRSRPVTGLAAPVSGAPTTRSAW